MAAAPTLQQVASPAVAAPAAPPVRSTPPSLAPAAERRSCDVQAGGSRESTQPAPEPAARRGLLVILHGRRADDDLLREALQELKAQGHEVSVRVTFDRGDVEQFVAEAIQLNRGRASWQTIVAGGGDGTLNEVVGALMAHRQEVEAQGLSLALLPLGTANDFACAAGISVDPREALALALDPSRARPIDVGRLNGAAHFLNVAVAGGLAEVDAGELSSKWKRLLGPLAIGLYVVRRLFKRSVLQPHRGAVISFDPAPATPPPPQRSTAPPLQHPQHGQPGCGEPQRDSLTLRTDLLMLVAGNSRQMGRTVAVCPDALLDDGLLDFTLLTGTNLASQGATLAATLASADDNDPAPDSGISQLRASRLEVVTAAGAGGHLADGQADDVLPVNRDGEPERASSRLVFEVVPGAINMHLPDDRLLVSGQQSAKRPPASSGSSAACLKGSVMHSSSQRFVPVADAAMPSAGGGAASTAAGGGSGGRGVRQSERRRRPLRRRGLTAATLRRMLLPAGPTGQGARRRAALLGAVRSLLTCVVLVAAGGLLGWAAGGHRVGSNRKEQQPQRAASTPQGGAAKYVRRAGHGVPA